jgi:uncharacterized protein YukE
LDSDTSLAKDLESILKESTAGDPMSFLKWTSKSAQLIAEELQDKGHSISAMTVDRILDQLDYSLQANRKSFEGKSPADRDVQFKRIQRKMKEYIAAGDPIISVDSKKKSV